MKFEEFKPVKDINYSSGWDKFALDYAQLSTKNRIYALSKQLIYKIIDQNIVLSEGSRILDIGCGSGNDFPFFLSKKSTITALDKSPGMLNMASKTYSAPIQSGQITLLKGELENFSHDSFAAEKFDLIFSITGGFSYINSGQLRKIYEILKSQLTTTGRIISGHFNPFCLPEFIYHLVRLDIKSATQRSHNSTQVDIKGEKMTMYFRSVKQLKHLTKDQFRHTKFYPLLAVTAPYQTGYNPELRLTHVHKRIELSLLNFALFTRIADQVIMVLENE